MLAQLEQIIQTDPGNRGLARMFLATEGELAEACGILENQKNVLIMTGFNLPPQETDGPPGALAIARALQAKGSKVCILTGSFCSEILRSGARVSDAVYKGEGLEEKIEEFPAKINEEEARNWAKAFIEREGFTAAVSIEIVGPASHDGRLYRMSGKDCTEENGKLYVVWEALGENVKKVSIGDGGNELGCGKFQKEFLESAIPNIQTICCRSKCDALILSGVSNWGGYALGTGLGSHGMEEGVISVEGERKILEELVKAGAVDPRKGSVMACDGMFFDEEHKIVIQNILAVSQGPGNKR